MQTKIDNYSKNCEDQFVKKASSFILANKVGTGLQIYLPRIAMTSHFEVLLEL